jgi:hypothetical protein
MLLCKVCWDKEAQIPINAVLKEARDIDTQVELRTDIFNAKTKAILDIKAAIDSDETIENKNLKLAEILKARFLQFRTVIFEAQQKIVDASNEQKAIQIYLNTLANQLRAEEREQLQLQNINYKPAQVKPAKTPKPKVRKLDKNELRRVAGQYELPEFLLQQIAVQKNMEIVDAAEFLKKQIEDRKKNIPTPVSE